MDVKYIHKYVCHLNDTLLYIDLHSVTIIKHPDIVTFVLWKVIETNMIYRPNFRKPPWKNTAKYGFLIL